MSPMEEESPLDAHSMSESDIENPLDVQSMSESDIENPMYDVSPLDVKMDVKIVQVACSCVQVDCAS